MDVGKPYTESYNMDLEHSIKCLRFFSGAADKITGQTLPVGKFKVRALSKIASS